MATGWVPESNRCHIRADIAQTRLAVADEAAPYAGNVTGEAIAAIAAIVLALVGLAGIVVPVLPGSIMVGAGALTWAIWGTSEWGWIALGLAVVPLLVGAASSWLLTGRSLRRRAVPTWPIAVGIVAGVVGMFVLPGLGLPIGFALGLLLAEWYRVRDFRQAATTGWETVRALGAGIVIELGCALVATSVLVASIVTAR